MRILFFYADVVKGQRINSQIFVMDKFLPVRIFDKLFYEKGAGFEALIAYFSVVLSSLRSGINFEWILFEKVFLN